MQPSEWPTGIPVLAKLLRRQARQCVPILRTAIERLAAESENAKAFDVAIAAFLKERRKSGPQHLAGPALDRLARLYGRLFRRELIRQHQYLQASPAVTVEGGGYLLEGVKVMSCGSMQ
jgi:hypothetical protein